MIELTTIDLLWLLLCTGQVLLMQVGFCMLESGMARAKNSINVAIKNLVDFCVSVMAFWAVGFGLMYGSSAGGWIGTTQFFLEQDLSSSLLAFFLFQVVFCGTATTIISGAVAERIRFRSYVIVSLFVSAIVYPIYGHWAWGGVLAESGSGWLGELGFIDFAGSTVVHSVGAWVALAAVLIIGPRMGRFGKRQRPIQSSNLPLVVMGVLILWFGWLGFNGGSGLALSDRVPLILVNTMISAAVGGLVSLAIVMFHLRRPDVATVGNGAVAGLVAITAGCHLMSPLASFCVGAVAAIVYYTSTYLLSRLRIDDVIGAISAHGLPGVWGTVAVALLTDPNLWENGNSAWTQFQIQALGCAAAFGWAFGISLVTLSVINTVYRLRVPRRHEYMGLNIAEHQANSELQELLTQMSGHRRGRVFNRRVKVEPFTEIGQVAAAYNRVLSEVDREIAGRLEAQNLYQSIFDHAVEGIYQTYPDGGFRSANPALAEILGFESAESLVQTIKHVSSDLYVDKESRDQFLTQIALHNRVVDFRSQVKRHDGKHIWISENARAVRDPHGNVMYFEGTIVDITQRLLSEQLQLQKEQAESASHAKSEFLAGMSHEMRTPLNGIVSMLELMSEEAMSAQQAKYLQIARRSSATLLAIINDILDLSKIEAGRLELESVPFSLLALIDETVEMLYCRAKSKRLDLAAHLDPDVPEWLLGDPVRLQQILINLISNAIKFTEEGGVSVRLLWKESDSTTNVGKTGALTIEVADTGIGIPLDRQAFIFDAFTQADASTTRRFGGSGLGLNICRQLVHAMGGEISVESELGVGSTFVCILQMAEPNGDVSGLCRTDVLKLRNHSPIAGKTILFVAPSSAEACVVEDYLMRWGARCITAETMPSAERLMSEETAPYVDLLMIASSVADRGRVACPKLSEIHRCIVIGDAMDEPHADSVVSQPVRPSALLETLKQIFDPTCQIERIRESRQPLRGDDTMGGGRRVLVVDDNDINTIVAAELLQRLGFEPDCVSSAEQAIDRVKRQDYDLILMDCEMPIMDGFEATRTLRQMHRRGQLFRSADQPLPIVALTVQAMAGQVERCFRAGMNARLAKPISRPEFARTLRDVLAMEDSIVSETTTTIVDENATAGRVPGSKPAIDWEELLARCGEKEQVCQRIVQSFREQIPERVAVLREAIRRGDEQAISFESHRIKGVAGNLSAIGLAAVATNIELESRSGDPSAASSYLHQLETELDRCLQSIDDRFSQL